MHVQTCSCVYYQAVKGVFCQHQIIAARTGTCRPATALFRNDCSETDGEEANRGQRRSQPIIRPRTPFCVYSSPKRGHCRSGCAGPSLNGSIQETGWPPEACELLLVCQGGSCSWCTASYGCLKTFGQNRATPPLQKEVVLLLLPP